MPKKPKIHPFFLLCLIMFSNVCMSISSSNTMSVEDRVNELLARMNLDEKIGQMSQVNGHDGSVPEHLLWALREGRVGSVLNVVDLETVNELQRIAVEESRLGIPLLIGRDVIHGFKTIFPIPLGQAATWNPEIVKTGARVAAVEASTVGVNWTFAPMIDISRDPRWGRIAESLGEDPYLASVLGASMVQGFQGDSLDDEGSIAACAKHFAGYGAAESGRDYSTTNINENELRNVYLPPFKAASDAGVASFMTAFSDLNGVPASGNEFLLKQVLRKEWDYDGFVVSDWESISQLSVHGFTENDKEAAFEAANAGIDMEMVSSTYANHLQALIEEGRITLQQVDVMVKNILKAKFELGLFENAYTDPSRFPALVNEDHLQAAREAAVESSVLLKNTDHLLPLSKEKLKSLAVIGPLADDPYEQLGTWIFDGDAQYSQTGLQAIQKLAGDSLKVHFAKGMATSRTKNRDGFEDALNAAKKSDAVVLFLGEESILSGEAHSRADISLPGYQEALIEEIAKIGKPVVLVIMAGRPLTIGRIVDKVDAILYAWHPGTMGGPAIADLLFGLESPSGKLPVTFPRVLGQIPIYYGQKNTGKPPSPDTIVHIDDIEPRAAQTSLGMTAFHLDVDYTPLYPFGYGLSYTEFKYQNLQLSTRKMSVGETIEISAELVNTGDVEAEEVAQLYVRDLVGNVTRPVKELKGFQKIRLKPGEKRRVKFDIHTDDLAFFNRKMELMVEPGEFHVWIGGSSDAELQAEFEIIKPSVKLAVE